MLFFLGKGLLGKTASTLFYGELLNNILGNPIGRLVDRLSGKTTTEAAKDNLNLNKKLLNMNDGRGVPTLSLIHI